MNISVDIDGVLIDRESYQVRKGLEYCKTHGGKMVDPNAYELYKMFGWKKEQETAFWNEFLFDYAESPAIGGAAEVLQKLVKQGHTIIINTSRWLTECDDEKGERMRQKVKSWFEENKLPHDEIVFAKGDKVGVIQAHKCHCHIDDNPPEIDEIAKHIPVICFHASYNKNYKGSNVLRATTWDDVYNQIQLLANNLKDLVWLQRGTRIDF